ncbi:hypothetical protein [Sphingomonas trueperi]|nr:hypothetical protein [Sphingomonas trueperi]
MMPGDGELAYAASLIVEAFGDVVPCANPKAIGDAILRPDTVLDPVSGKPPSMSPETNDER